MKGRTAAFCFVHLRDDISFLASGIKHEESEDFPHHDLLTSSRKTQKRVLKGEEELSN